MQLSSAVASRVAARICVQRREILDLAAYEARRHVLRPELMREKQLRQVLVGETLNFMFESLETVRYQIQEVLRAEVVTDELGIQREIETYNRLLGAPGALGCTLLVELGGDSASHSLEALAELERSLYVRMPSGHRVHADATSERSPQRLSLVQFLSFAVRGVAPVAVGCAHPLMGMEASLSREQRRALQRDLSLGLSLSWDEDARAGGQRAARGPFSARGRAT